MFSRILPRNISPNTVCDRSSRVVSLLSGSVIGRRSSALTGRCRSLHYQEILLMVLSIRKIRLRPRSTRMWRLRRWVIHASSFRQVHNQKARIGKVRHRHQLNGITQKRGLINETSESYFGEDRIGFGERILIIAITNYP